MTIEMPALIGVGFLLFRFLGLRQTPCQSEIRKVPRFFLCAEFEGTYSFNLKLKEKWKIVYLW